MLVRLRKGRFPERSSRSLSSRPRPDAQSHALPGCGPEQLDPAPRAPGRRTSRPLRGPDADRNVGGPGSRGRGVALRNPAEGRNTGTANR